MTDKRWPEIGKFNHLEASVGQRGMGKSTWQQYRVLQLQRKTGAYVIGHSLGARLNRTMPKELGGAEIPIKYHLTMRSLERGLRWWPGKWHILAPPLSPDGSGELAGEALATADDLLKFAARLSDAVKKSAWKKQHPFRIWNPNVDYKDVKCPPVIVLIDEGIAIESAGVSRKEDNRWFLQFLYSLRHMHVALFYAIQDGSARNWRVLEQATRIFVFAVRHAWALLAYQAAGATKDEIEQIKRLRPYEHVEIAALDVEKLKKETGGKMPGEDEKEAVTESDKKPDDAKPGDAPAG